MPIVAAVDRSERAGSVIRQARELADAYEVELHVVHVKKADTDTPATTGTYLDPEVEFIRGGTADMREKTDNIREGTGEEDNPMEEAKQIAAEIAQGVEGHGEFRPVGLVGDAAPELINYGEQHNAEHIVVSARKRSSLGQVLFGSVSQALLLNADRPVVAAPQEPE